MVVKIGKGKLPAKKLGKIVEIIAYGGLIVFPTETVYGIGADAFNRKAIKRIYRLKKRQENKPLQILVANSEMAWPLVSEEVPREARKLAAAFWPGPLTLVMPASVLGKLVTGGQDTIGIRVPKQPAVQELIRKLGKPLASTSANVSGEPAFTSGASAARIFKEKVECVLDGGKTRLGKESSVVSVAGYPFRILREGAINKNEILQVIGLGV